MTPASWLRSLATLASGGGIFGEGEKYEFAETVTDSTTVVEAL